METLACIADFTRLQPADLNMLGVGARLGVNVRKHVVLEGEMAYDFERTKTQVITVGILTSTVRSNLRHAPRTVWSKDPKHGPGTLFRVAERRLCEFWCQRPGDRRRDQQPDQQHC